MYIVFIYRLCNITSIISIRKIIVNYDSIKHNRYIVVFSTIINNKKIIYTVKGMRERILIKLKR